MPSSRVFLTLATVMGFSLIIGLAVLVILVRTADDLPTPTPPVIILQAPTPTLPPTEIPTPVSACMFNWARQDLPETTAAAQKALDAAGIRQTTVRVEAYGEDCIDPQTQQKRYFAAMTTDFYFTAQVDDVTDEDAAAAFVRPLYHIALALPREHLPAPPGYLDVTFITASGGETRHLRTRFDEAQAAIRQNLRGKALIRALGGLL